MLFIFITWGSGFLTIYIVSPERERESYGIWQNWGYNGSFSGSFHILEASRMALSLCVRCSGVSSAHLAFLLIWQTTPVFNSHVTLNVCLRSVSPFCLPRLTPAHPGHTPLLSNIPMHVSSHTFPIPDTRGAFFFQLLSYDIHCHNMVSQFWKGWGWGDKPFLYTHWVNKALC